MFDFIRSLEPTYISKNVEYDKTSTDGRMFNNIILYCEGAHKPKWRGWLHVIVLFMFPYIFWKFYELTKDSDIFYLAMFCVLTGFVTVLISALYHTVCWSIPQEILINKLDHVSLIIFTMSIFYPTLLILLPPHVGYTFCAIITGLALWNVYGTFFEPPSLFRMMSVPFSQVPTFYHYYLSMTDLEWWAFWTSGISQILGVLGFVKEFTIFDPDVFGFHENYHVSTIVSFIAAYVMNYSIMERSLQKSVDTVSV
jgi:hemolysin III